MADAVAAARDGGVGGLGLTSMGEALCARVAEALRGLGGDLVDESKIDEVAKLVQEACTKKVSEHHFSGIRGFLKINGGNPLFMRVVNAIHTAVGASADTMKQFNYRSLVVYQRSVGYDGISYERRLLSIGADRESDLFEVQYDFDHGGLERRGCDDDRKPLARQIFSQVFERYSLRNDGFLHDFQPDRRGRTLALELSEGCFYPNYGVFMLRYIRLVTSANDCVVILLENSNHAQFDVMLIDVTDIKYHLEDRVRPAIDELLQNLLENTEKKVKHISRPSRTCFGPDVKIEADDIQACLEGNSSIRKYITSCRRLANDLAVAYNYPGFDGFEFRGMSSIKLSDKERDDIAFAILQSFGPVDKTYESTEGTRVLSWLFGNSSSTKKYIAEIDEAAGHSVSIAYGSYDCSLLIRGKMHTAPPIEPIRIVCTPPPIEPMRTIGRPELGGVGANMSTVSDLLTRLDVLA